MNPSRIRPDQDVDQAERRGEASNTQAREDADDEAANRLPPSSALDQGAVDCIEEIAPEEDKVTAAIFETVYFKSAAVAG